MSLSNHINELRKAVGMGIDELSEKSGVPKSTLAKITAGITQNPNLDTVKAIATALNCTLDDLDDSVENKKAPPAAGGAKAELFSLLEQLSEEDLRKVSEYAVLLLQARAAQG